VDVVTGQGRDGVAAHAFDVRMWTDYDVTVDDDGNKRRRRRRNQGGERGFSNVERRHQGATTSAAMTTTPLRAPRLVVAKENVASKLFSRATRLDLDLESESFNRSYHVICRDRAFARAVLDARMIDMMVRSEGRMSFEFVDDWLLVHTDRVEPELMPGLVAYAHDVRSVISRQATEGWPALGDHTRA